MNKKALIIAMVLAPLVAPAQEAVQVGRGSYAAYPPTAKGLTDAHSGDKSTLMQNRQLYINETHTLLGGQETAPPTCRPIPTNDWWTDLIVEPFADALWSYPQMVHPSEDGVTVNYPTYWIDNGTEMKSRTSITVSGKGFVPTAATADDWHDWDVEMLMKDATGKRRLRTTLVHGTPLTWFETAGLQPQLSFSDTPTFLNAAGEEVQPADVTTGQLAIRIGDDVYGLYTAEGMGLRYADGTLRLLTSDPTFLVVALLPSVDDLEAFAPYAYSKPTGTSVSWKYNERRGVITSTWTVEAVNLKDATADAPVLQGFLPHAYRNTTTAFDFTAHSFLTPRGRLKLATSADNTFAIDMDFSGILPYYAAPAENEATTNPFSRETMLSLLQDYANGGTFGDDTYWGGKGLTQMALCMTFAHQLGYDDVFKTCRERLKAKLVDWLTYEPGESQDFFAFYPRWGALVGFDTSYDSDTFNDHHFHYGYFVYAGALLCLFDDDFREGYGDMLRLVAKDYANWDREDARFPFLRTLDPWAGHSYAGGLGDGANSNGNGQESSSEAMQAWGGVYLLGVALGDDEMRDAGIFGWATESRGTAEYWFDRGHVVDGVAQTGTSDDWNYDYSRYASPYCTNLTSKGIGWWTWFSGDALWMHSIQWMPVSPCLNYLSEDLDFVRWDYETMMKSTAYEWFATSSAGDALANQSVGNVVLCYMERYDPDSAAAIFDQALEGGYGIAKNVDTGHISYYVIHSHRTYGDIDFTRHADLPTATAYRKGDTYNYVVYNPDNAARTVHFYDAEGTAVAEFTVPAHAMSVNGEGTSIVSDDNAADSTATADELPLFNVALGKTAHASSEENAGTLTTSATDGDASTRWGSAHTDDEWIYVDLGASYDISSVEILWEAAYASSYELQVSDDGETWRTVKTVVACTGGTDRQSVEATARYVRMQGLSRATNYGYSLYEFRVFGIPTDADETTVVGFGVSADSTYIKQGSTVKLKALAYTRNGEATPTAASWVITDAEGNTVLTAPLASDASSTTVDFTPTTYGAFTCTATSGSTLVGGSFAAEASCVVNVEEARAPYSISVSPATAQLVVGETLDLTATVLDQFGGTWATASKQFVATAVGEFPVSFDIDGLQGSAVVTVTELSGLNLALDRPIVASSNNGDGVAARYANDGNATGTRWESSWTDEERTLTLDLESAYKLNRMVLTWENAYASRYHIDYSLDGQTWPSLVATTDKTSVDADTLTLPSTTARYLRLTADEKALTAYGVSLYEWEVYGTERVPQMWRTADATPRHLAYEGEWEEAVLEVDDDTLVTSFDLSNVTALPEVKPAVFNANAVFYVCRGGGLQAADNATNTYMLGHNVVADGHAETLVLKGGSTDGFDFAPVADFTATSAHLVLTLPAERYCLITLPFAPTALPTGLTLYVPTAAANGVLTVVPVIAAQAGRVYIAKAETAGSYVFSAETNDASTSEADVEAVKVLSAPVTTTEAGITLVGTFQTAVVPAGAYCLTGNGLFERNTPDAPTVAPFSGYIASGLVPDASGAVRIAVEGEETGIGHATTTPPPASSSDASATWFNLAGQRVPAATLGLVVKRGEKRLMK